LLARIRLLNELALSVQGGEASAQLAVAYQAVFGAPVPANVVWAHEGREPTLNGWLNPAFDDVAIAGSADYLSLLKGLVACAEAGSDMVDILPQLRRNELALLFGLCRSGQALPFSLVDAAGAAAGPNQWPAAGMESATMSTEDLATACASGGSGAYAALGVRPRTVVMATNGLKHWHALISDPNVLASTPDGKSIGNLPKPVEFLCSLHVISAHLRACADEAVRRSNRCEALATLLSGQEFAPQGVAWTDEDLQHSQDVFCDKTFVPLKSMVAQTRGSRQLLWGALTTYLGSHETYTAHQPYGGSWNQALCFTALQGEVLTGMASSVGGIVGNTGVFRHIGRQGQSFLNVPLRDSDLSRANRLHLLAIFSGLFESSLTAKYTVRYKTEEYGEYGSYDMPIGALTMIRVEGTSAASECCSSVQWMVTLNDMQIELTGTDTIPGCGLIVGEARPLGVVHDNWWPGPVGEVCSIGPYCPGLAIGPTEQLLGRWRSRTALPAAGVDNDNPLTDLTAKMQLNFSACRRLAHVGDYHVPYPWARVGPLVDAVTDKATFVSTETGANRFMMQMAALAGLPTTAEEVAALVAKEEQAQAAARREAENAPLVTHANTVAALEARLLVLETELSRVNAANAAAGGAGDAGNRAKRVSQDDTPSVVGDASTAETAASTLTPSE
jgi:hypothetical protein